MLVHALAGHAAGPSSLRPLNLLAQWTHLLAVGVWIGGLAWLFAGLGRRATARPTREVVRFSKLAGISLAVVVVTGVVRTADELGGWGRLVDGRFGWALDLKLLLFAGLVGLGALNRYRLVPLVQAGARRRAATNCGAASAPSGWRAACWPPPPCSASWPRAPRTGPSGAGGHTGPGGPGPTGPPPSGHLDRDPGGRRAEPLHRHRGRLRHRGGPARRRVELTGTPASHPDLAGARLELAGGRRPLARPGPPAVPGRPLKPPPSNAPAQASLSPWPWRVPPPAPPDARPGEPGMSPVPDSSPNEREQSLSFVQIHRFARRGRRRMLDRID